MVSQNDPGPFAWYVSGDIPMDCFTFAEKMTADEVLAAVGATRWPDPIRAGDLQAESLPNDLAEIRVATCGEWAVLIEFESLLGGDERVLARLSQRGLALNVMTSGDGMSLVHCYEHGELTMFCETIAAYDRQGSAPDRYIEQMRRAGLEPGQSEEIPAPWAKLAFAAELTGVVIDQELAWDRPVPGGLAPPEPG